MSPTFLLGITNFVNMSNPKKIVVYIHKRGHLEGVRMQNEQLVLISVLFLLIFEECC